GYAYGFTHNRFSCAHAASAIQRIALLGVDTELGDGLGHDLAFDGAAIGECLQRGDSHPAAVDFEEVAQLGARVAAAEAVGAQHLVFAGRNPLANLVGEQLHVVGGGDHRAFAAFQALLDVALALLLGRVQAVPAIDRQAVAAQLVEAGHAPDVGAHAHLGEDVHRSAHFAQDGAAAQQLHTVHEVALGFLEQVHALDDAVLDALRHGRLLVVLVHHGDVVVDALLLLHHLVHAVMHDHRQLVAVGGVIAAAVGDGAGEDVAVAVLVLQAFAVQRGASGGAAQQEATGLGIARRPGQVADTLEAEHRIEDVDRQHRLVVVAVGGTGGHERGEGAGFVQAFLQDLAVLLFAVVHHLVAVDRLVQLPHGGVDAELAEHAFHTEGTGFVGKDRHDALAQILVLDQLGQDAAERHGGGDFAIAGAIEHGFQGFQRWRRNAEALGATLRQMTTELFAALAQVAHFRAVFGRAVERQFFELRVVDRNVETVAEHLQAVDIDLLGVV